MRRLGLIIFAFWPLVLLGQSTAFQKGEDREFYQANDLWFKKKYLQAAQKWEDLEIRPMSILELNDQYLSRLARQLLLRQHSNLALEEFFDQNPTHPDRSKAFLVMGLEAFRNRNYSGSIKYFEKVSYEELDSKMKSEFLFKKGYSYMLLEQIDPAIENLDKVKGGNSKYSSAAYYYSGYLQFTKGNNKRAKQDFKNAAQDDTYSGTVNDFLAVIYYREGDMQSLVDFAEKIESSKSKGSHIKNLNRLVGDAYFSQRKFEKAWEYFSKSQPKNSNSLSAPLAYRYGRTLYEIESYEKAEKFLKVGVSKSKNDTLTQYCSYYAAANSIKVEDYASAALFFDKTMELDVSKELKESAEYNSAKIRIREGSISRGIERLEAYKKNYPKGKFSREADILLAESYLNSNRYLDGINHLEKSGDWNSKNKAAYQKLCLHHASEKFNDRQFDSALIFFDKSLKYPIEKGLSIEAHFWKAESYSIKREYGDAANSYARVFVLDPNKKSKYYYRSRYGIGFAYFKDKKYERALGHYTAFLDSEGPNGKSKNFQDALLRRGDCYFIIRNYDKAMVDYKKVVTRGFRNRDYALFRMGEISWINDDRETAIKAFSKLIEQYPKSPYLDDAKYELATVHFESGEFARASSEYQNLINTFPLSTYIPISIYKQGMSYSGLNNHEKALGNFRKFMKDYPRHPKGAEVLSSLHESLINLGREDEFEKDKIAFNKANPDSKALESIEFENAKEIHLEGNYSRSVKLLSSFIRGYGGSSFRLEALNMLADGYYYEEEYDSAFKYYGFIKEYGPSDNLKKSVERRANISYKKKDYASAVEDLEQWFNMSSSGEEQVMAQEGLMISYFELGEYDSTAAIAGRISEVESPFGNRNQALLYKGKALYELGKLDAAKDQFVLTVGEASDENAAEAKFMIASIQNQLAEYKASTETCLELVSEFNQYAYWNDQAFLLIADNFLGLDDVFQARATLESIIQNSPDPTTVDQAREQLIEVGAREKEIEQLKDTIE